MKITTLDDARTYVGNTGPGMWDEDAWGGTASAAGWAEWIFRHRDHLDGEEDFRCALREYLQSEGEDPADYDL